MAFVFDYFHAFSEFRTADNNFYDAIGVGIEIETGGHVFHLNVTNSAGLIANDIIPYTTSDWGQGEYKLGFNISRVFSF
jgi:5-hydroxyisourate hydrolase-like protein (transthyretin family)